MLDVGLVDHRTGCHCSIVRICHGRLDYTRIGKNRRVGWDDSVDSGLVGDSATFNSGQPMEAPQQPRAGDVVQHGDSINWIPDVVTECNTLITPGEKGVTFLAVTEDKHVVGSNRCPAREIVNSGVGVGCHGQCCR